MSLSSSFGSDPVLVTTDNTETDAVTITIPIGNTCQVHARVLARGLDTGASAYWEISGLVKSVNGTRSIVNAAVNLLSPIKDVAATLWNARFVISGTDLVFKVTGSGSQSVGWFFSGDVTGFSNYNVGGML